MKFYSAALLLLQLIYSSEKQECSICHEHFDGKEKTPTPSDHTWLHQNYFDTWIQFSTQYSTCPTCSRKELNKSLQSAVQKSNNTEVNRLIQAGAEVNWPGKEGYTTVHHAAYYCNSEAIMIILLKNGGKVNAVTHNGNTPLHWAARVGNVSIASALLAQNAEVNAKNDYGYTPLMLIAREGHAKFLKLLLDNGANATLKNDVGKTALDYTRDKVCRSFLKWSINKSFREAAKGGTEKEIKRFLARGADINVADKEGMTALHFAATREDPSRPSTWRLGNPKVVKLLLKCGADPNLQNSQGQTALDRTSHETCRALLQKDFKRKRIQPNDN